MSSSQRKNLTTESTSKGAGATVIGDTLVLPPDCDELILAITADSSISGAVDAILEVSADGINWAPAKTSTGASGGGVAARISVDNVDNQIDLNIVNTPALDAAQYTDVCRVSFAGATEAIDAEYTLTLSGTDASLYRLNNVTSGDVSAPVTAQFEDDVVLETASTFAYTTSGYEHDVTITVSEDSGLTTDKVDLNIKRVLPATLTNGTVADMEGDSADGTDTCTLTPGGGPSTPVAATYSLAITGTDAAYYRIHNTTTGDKSDDGAPLKTLSGIALGDSIVLEADELFNFSEATTHSVTVTNTESIKGETASVNLTITVNAIATFTNAKYVDFSDGTDDQYVEMGVKADWDDSDSFFLKRQTDKWTISWWMKHSTINTSSWWGGVEIIFNLMENINKGFFIIERSSQFQLYFRKGSGNTAHIKWSSAGWNDGNWHHYTLTWDGPGATTAGAASADAYAKLYRNGSLQTQDTYVYSGDFLATNEEDTVTNNFRLGNNSFDYSSHTNKVASYDEIAIWKTDLSASQVATVYNSGTPNDISSIESSNLKRYYRFETLKGWDLPSVSANAFIKMGTQSDFDNSGDGFNFRRGTDDFSISFWMKHSTINSGTTRHIIFSYGASDGASGFHLRERSSNFQFVYSWHTTGLGIYAYPKWVSTGWNDSNWHHYVVTVKASTISTSNFTTNIKLYRDGSLVSVASGTSGGDVFATDDVEDNLTTEHFRFGTDLNTANDNKVTSYKEIAIWKTELTSSNVTTLYNSGVPYGDDTTSLEASNLKRFYKGDTTDAAGNFTAVVGSDVGLISEDTKGNFDGTLGTDPTIEDY